jgi:hypothetical protein
VPRLLHIFAGCHPGVIGQLEHFFIPAHHSGFFRCLIFVPALSLSRLNRIKNSSGRCSLRNVMPINNSNLSMRREEFRDKVSCGCDRVSRNGHTKSNNANKHLLRSAKTCSAVPALPSIRKSYS